MIRLFVFAALAALSLNPRVALANEAVTYFTLDNGMEVIVVEDHRAPVVQHMVWYRAGSADEPKGASGVAHFLEHLLFKATDKLDAGEFSAVVAANGGRDNAFTSYDYTAYHQRIAADRLELMMSMESDRMKNIRLTQEDIDTERGVVIEERNQRTENSPGALMNEQLRAAQYLNHRYGVPIIGWMHEIEDLGMEDTMAFYDLYYSPNNAILVVSGDVEPDEVRALAEKYYGVIPANPDLPERLRTEEPPQTAERRLVFRDDRVAQPYMNRSYIAPERDPGDQTKAAALTILAEVLGGGTTSYMAEKMQFDTQVSTYTSSYYRGKSLDDASFHVIAVPSADVSLREVEDAVDATIASFLEDGVDAEQLERIKAQIRAEQIFARDDANSVASRYGSALAIGLSVEDVQQWPEVLEAVTEEDIMQAAREVLQISGSVTGWLTNEEAAQ